MAGQIGVALFGLGRAGSIHFNNILANYRVKFLYLVEKNLDLAKKMVDKYGLSGTVEVISPEQEDIVYNDPKRFDPSIRQLKNRVKAGEVGDILSIKSVARDHPFPPLEYLKVSGGFFHDCAVHDLDLICWILGEYPLTVYTVAHAHIQPIKDMQDVDNAAILMKFPSNVLASIDISRHACYGYDQRCEVFGMNGMLVSENQRVTELAAFNKLGSSHEPLKHSFPERYADSYVNALNEFLDIVEGKIGNEISKEHTVKITMLASACEESYKLGEQIKFEGNNHQWQ